MGNPQDFEKCLTLLSFVLSGLNALKEQLNGQLPSVAIVGSSFIGMELGAAITEKKAGKVTIISKSKVPFQRVLGERIGEALMRRHQSKGVQFVTEAKVKGFEPKSNAKEKRRLDTRIN